QGVARVRVRAPAATDRAQWLINAEVRDAAGFTVKGHALIQPNHPPYDIRVGFDRMFYEREERINAVAKVVSTDGQPAADAEVELIAMYSDAASDGRPRTRDQFERSVYGKTVYEQPPRKGPAEFE